MKNEIFVLDLATLGTWTQQVDPQHETLRVIVRTTTEAEATDLVQQVDEANPLAGEALANETRAKQLDARIEVHERVNFTILDPSAASRLRVQPNPTATAPDAETA